MSFAEVQAPVFSWTVLPIEELLRANKIFICLLLLQNKSKQIKFPVCESDVLVASRGIWRFSEASRGMAPEEEEGLSALPLPLNRWGCGRGKVSQNFLLIEILLGSWLQTEANNHILQI